MKVCIYLEGERYMKGGIGVALENQKKALDLAGIEHTDNPKDDYDILHINTIFPRSLLYAKQAKKRGKKVIMHAHTLEEDTKDSYRFTNTISPMIKKYLKFFYSQADRIICPSLYVVERLTDYGLKNKMSVVSNGVDLEKFSFSNEGREEYRKRFDLQGIVPFSVGHIFMRKGVVSFAEVAKDFPNDFIWFGKIYHSALVKDNKLESAIKNSKENVRFAGYVDDIVAAYSSGDILFFPSKSETQGIVILEAWAMGRPVLIRDIPAYEGWTHGGVDCIKAKDDSDFKEKLKELISDEDLRKRLIDAGRKEVQKHSLENIGQLLKDAYDETLDT